MWLAAYQAGGTEPVGWWDLVTNSHQFPRLVVRSNGRVEKCPPVLVWGGEAPTAFEAAARKWCRRG